MASGSVFLRPPVYSVQWFVRRAVWCGCGAEHACANQVAPLNGDLACRHLEHGVECEPSCHRGFDFAVIPADKYFCRYDDGLWTPADQWPVRDCACTSRSLIV